MNKPITILGATGDLGSQLANRLAFTGSNVHIVTRIGTLTKLQRRVRLGTKTKINQVETLFDKQIIENILRNSLIVFNFAGLVSLSFAPKVFPTVLLINGLFPGVLAYLNKKHKTRIVYASTQRLFAISKNKTLRLWAEQAAKEFYLRIRSILKNNEIETALLRLSNEILQEYPLPDRVNIYDASKILGEFFLKDNQPSIILRVSSCFGPGCSLRRTVGRLTLARFLGNTKFEKQETRDYIFCNDLSKVFEKIITMQVRKPLIEYCSSGTSVSKMYIFRQIKKNTPGKTGGLRVIKVKEKETFYPPALWFSKVLGTHLVSMSKGIQKTVEYVQETYFSENASMTARRLEAVYDSMKQKTDESGVDPRRIEEIRQTFFVFTNDRWVAHEAFWKPTGIVFGFPFTTELQERFASLRSEILDKTGLSKTQYWLPTTDQLHATVVSYSHYSEAGMSLVSLPEEEVPKAKQIIAAFQPIPITFEGVLITTDGSVLVKGFTDDENLFMLRDELQKGISRISQKPQNFIHVKVAQLLTDVPYGVSELINRLYEHTPVAKHAFDYIKCANGELLYFSSSV